MLLFAIGIMESLVDLEGGGHRRKVLIFSSLSSSGVQTANLSFSLSYDKVYEVELSCC